MLLPGNDRTLEHLSADLSAFEFLKHSIPRTSGRYTVYSIEYTTSRVILPVTANALHTVSFSIHLSYADVFIWVDHPWNRREDKLLMGCLSLCPRHMSRASSDSLLKLDRPMGPSILPGGRRGLVSIPSQCRLHLQIISFERSAIMRCLAYKSGCLFTTSCHQHRLLRLSLHFPTTSE